MTPFVVDWFGIVSLDALGQKPVALLHSVKTDATTRTEQWVLFNDTSTTPMNVAFATSAGTVNVAVPARRPFPEQLPGATLADPNDETPLYFQRLAQPSQTGTDAARFFSGARASFAGLPHRYVWAKVKESALTPTTPVPAAEVLLAPSPGAAPRGRGWQQRQYALSAQVPPDAERLWTYGEWSVPAAGYAAQRVHMAWRADQAVSGPTLAMNALLSATPPTQLTGWLASCRTKLAVTQAAPARYALAEARLYPAFPATMPV